LGIAPSLDGEGWDGVNINSQSPNNIEVGQRSFPGWGRLGWGEFYTNKQDLK